MTPRQALTYLEKYAISETTGDETPHMRAAFAALRSAVEDQERMDQYPDGRTCELRPLYPKPGGENDG